MVWLTTATKTKQKTTNNKTPEIPPKKLFQGIKSFGLDRIIDIWTLLQPEEERRKSECVRGGRGLAVTRATGRRRGGGRSSRGFFPAPRAKASRFWGTRELLQLLRPSLGSLGVCLTLPLRRLPRPSAGPGLALRLSAWAPSGHFSLSRSAFIFSLLRYFQSPKSRQASAVWSRGAGAQLRGPPWPGQ